LVIHLLALLAFFGARRSYKGFQEDLPELKRSGKIFAWITLFIAGLAAYFSAWLLLVR